jgi:flagellar biosynthesis anti-sigma factor FlgM
MSKINVNKANDLDSIRGIRQAELKRTEEAKTSLAGGKNSIESDKLQFSERATEVGSLINQVKTFPDVRAEKVENFREQIAAGSYDPPGEIIADAILNEDR